MQRAEFSVLVVDDNPATRYSLARTLRAAGYRTMEANSGAEALELAEYVQAMVLDVHLLDLHGWEVCRLLRARLSTATLPIIHVTARGASDEDRVASEASGANRFFPAPMAPGLLVEALDELIRSR
jgi:DNA-binding response OmpR family regulator